MITFPSKQPESYTSRHEDCQREGTLGLLQAIDRIKPGKPFDYAFYWARRRIKSLMISHLPVSAPVNLSNILEPIRVPLNLNPQTLFWPKV